MALNETKPKSIIKLDQHVINKICAGEVINRPLNVVKELIENSLDAGATSIIVTLKNGGMKSIIIEDNGCGIQKEDLEIACKRFTTSKLTNYEDLQSLSTFGFRGEALSSISTVAHLTITTKTTSTSYGYKAEYVDGILKANTGITPVACRNGTTIIVENLFYNMPTRKAALSSESTEFALVQDMLIRYSILHSQKCGFILKKKGENTCIVNTNVSHTIRNNINNLYAQDISSHLIALKSANEKLGFQVEGLFSNSDLNLKKMHFLLFINSRLVECSTLKKSIRDVYKNFLMKGGHCFVYLTIQINPKNIDVNVHPTKNEVCFLYENEILGTIVRCIEERLSSKDSNQIPSQAHNHSSQSSNLNYLKKQSTLDNFREKNEIGSRSNSSLPQSSSIKQTLKINLGCKDQSRSIKPNIAPKPYRQVRTDSKSQRINQYLKQKQNDCKKRRELKLDSLLRLQNEVFKSCDQNLFDTFEKSTYVGCVDENFALIQNDLDLLMIDIRKLSEELFYQIYLIDFGNFDYIKFQKPLPLMKLLSTYFQVNPSNITNVMGRIGEMVDFLVSHSKMLNDYFSMKINPKDATIETLPCLMKDHAPVMTFLPDFIHALVFNVNWEDEDSCFRAFGKELARFYSRPPVKLSQEQYLTWAEQVEDKLYPLYKKLLVPSRKLTDTHTIHTVANINSLYKVFERC